jgi:hypothetical protein
MSTYPREIEGKYDLGQINIQIAGEEAGASEFVKSEVTSRNNKMTNIVTFRELPAGTLPKPIILSENNEPSPAGTAMVWSGVMIVKDTSTAVKAFRNS